MLPVVAVNDYSTVQRISRQQKLERMWSVQEVYHILDALDVNSATGPDLLPARILKHCAQELAAPELKPAERIMETGKWSYSWREHWIVPIYKWKAVCHAGNYRGVHLTAQLSKAIERLVMKLLMPHVSRLNLAGINRFAYTKKRGARDFEQRSQDSDLLFRRVGDLRQGHSHEDAL